MARDLLRHDTIAPMRIPKPASLLLAAAALAVLSAGLYQVPAINYRLSWRIERAQTYAYSFFNPAGAVPTPLPQPTETPGPTQTPTATLPPPTPTATQPGPTPTLPPTPTAIPAAVILPSPAFEKQDMNNCGPASLAMYLRFYGWGGDQFTISELIKPRREDRNVNVEEMVYFVRNRAGWLSAEFRVGGDQELIKRFVAAGIPVITEEGMQLDEPAPFSQDYWAAHYLLITGYDDAAGVFIAQDTFKGPDQRVPYAEMDQTWKEFNRVYILVYPPSQEETVKEILGPHWDMRYNREQALEKSQAESEADPEDAFAWFNLGSNLVYFERYSEAALAYDTARTIGLPQRMLRYQFGPFFAYFHTFRTDDLLALAEHALLVTRNSEEAFLWRGWGRYRSGDRAGAIADFQAALEANPNYQDAVYALDFVRSQP
jgi:tetratricopeptide (TPR) repeat protein